MATSSAAQYARHQRWPACQAEGRENQRNGCKISRIFAPQAQIPCVPLHWPAVGSVVDLTMRCRNGKLPLLLIFGSADVGSGP